VLQEAIDEFLRMPPWARTGVTLFVLTFLYTLIAPSVSRRRYRRHFNAILAAFGQPPPSGDWPFTAAVTADGGRAFRLTYDMAMPGKGSSYRGPRGHLLTAATQLAGDRWSMHQVDVKPMTGRISRWVMRRVNATPDAAFNERFLVRQDGLPPREHWLDASTRQAFTHFFDAAPTEGEIWIREGSLQFLSSESWKGLDGQSMRRLLDGMTTLAAALDDTSRRHPI
jgi:hypothetical protein